MLSKCYYTYTTNFTLYERIYMKSTGYNRLLFNFYIESYLKISTISATTVKTEVLHFSSKPCHCLVMYHATPVDRMKMVF